jgi:endonuclease/exonuclease/phosphatase family metal-dependent hydrolase
LTTILSHNIFWLQGVPFETDEPGDPRADVLEALISVYAEINPDVICLQEVQSRAAFDLIRSAVGMDGTYCPGATLSQYGGATFWHSGRPVSDGTGAEDPPQRVRQLSEIDTGQSGSLVVCNVHLPSSRQLGEEGGAARRLEELETATESMPEVVVGDLNEGPGGAVIGYMGERGYLDAAVLRNKGDVPSSVGGLRGDQIWIRSDLGVRLAEYSVLPKGDLATQLDAKTYLSDHLPLWIRLEEGA